MSQMVSNQVGMALEPIAIVKNGARETGRRDWDRVVSELILRPDLEDALDGLEKFSHLIVIFWMHLSPSGECAAHKTHPQMRPDLPLVGLFATRSPVRINPLGLSVVMLLERKGNILKVVGLDALDGTPVLDIKPYLPGDSVAHMKVPEWVQRLHKPVPR